MKIKNYLKVLRTRRGISQTKMAELLHISRQAIHGFESDSYVPSMDVATQIAEILNVPISVLFSPEEASSQMHAPIALIADCESDNQRLELGKRLNEVFPSDRMQTVVRAREGACPRWDWDPKGERSDGKPGIAIRCDTQRQFDELAVLLRGYGCKSIDCGIGMDRFPTIAYFAADTKYARDKLSSWQPDGAPPLPPTPAIDEIVVDQPTADLIQQALLDANSEAVAFSKKCKRFGQDDYGDHYEKMADDILDLRDRLSRGERVIRWSFDYGLLTESLLAAEVKARNGQDMQRAKQYFLVRKAVEDQAR